MVTLRDSMSGMDADTSRRMPSTCSGVRLRPSRSVTAIDAVGTPAPRRNRPCSGKAISTRADSTLDRDRMVRVISCRARW